MTETRFGGRSVIVTGGASGIGLAIATRFAQDGAGVMIADLDAAKSSAAAADLAAKTGATVVGAACDVSDENAVAACAQATLDKFGSLDIVVNNAGLMTFNPLSVWTNADWMKVLHVDLLGAAMFTKQLFLHVGANGGAIVNISSVHAIQTEADAAPYSAAKAALLSLTRTTSIEGRPKKIRANAILPGAINTPMLWDNPNVKSGAEKIDPADVGQPEDIAAVAAFLASDDARFVTGVSLPVDGGRLAKLLNGNRIRLETGRLALEVVPSVGGSIAKFERRAGDGWEPIFRRTRANYEKALDAALFPLIPFANRIRGGSFTCGGSTITLPANMAGDKSPIHGQGWQNPWRVREQDGASIDLLYRHEADEWPWTYDAALTYEIDETRLRVILTCANRSPKPMPCGLGLHPYYDCDPSTLLSTIVSQAWTIDADVLPVEAVPPTGRYAVDGGPVCGRSLDNGYDGWSGETVMTWPDRDLRVRMICADARRFQLYSPPSGGIFVAEPVQNANCALNQPQNQWAELGITMVGEGDSVTLDVTFDVGVA